MSLSQHAEPEAASGSVIELERIPSHHEPVRSEDANLKSAVVDTESTKRPVVSDANEVVLERARSSATNSIDVESGVEDAGGRGGASTLDGGSVDELSQRNISSLAPTDEGFNAWAFVSALFYRSIIQTECHHSFWQRSSSRALSGPSRHLTVFS